jgi:hypothetical protein
MPELEIDKFVEMQLARFPEQMHWKLYRAKLHFQEFEREAAAYMNAGPSGPGEMMLSPQSTPEKPLFIYDTKKPVPAKFGLIAGDFLQNLRSVFDYLVWQLILVNGKVPHKTRTAFPVCHSKKSWDDCYKRKLGGVSDEAIALIEAMQPYPERQKGSYPQTLEILEELTNENKHRQVLFTALGTRIKPDLPFGIPHIELEVTRNFDGYLVPGEHLLVYLRFQSGIIQGLEVTATLSGLMDWVGFDILPQFERFF